MCGAPLNSCTQEPACTRRAGSSTTNAQCSTMSSQIGASQTVSQTEPLFSATLVLRTYWLHVMPMWHSLLGNTSLLNPVSASPHSSSHILQFQPLIQPVTWSKPSSNSHLQTPTPAYSPGPAVRVQGWLLTATAATAAAAASRCCARGVH